MNISISNMAWEPHDHEEKLKFFQKVKIKNIEGIFTKIKNWDELSTKDIFEFVSKCADKNINVSSFQSIFYNTPIQSFSEHKLVSNHLLKVVEFAKVAKSNIIVLGSPSLRKSDSLDGLSKSLKFIDKKLKNENIKICIEPNCKLYGGFYFHSLEDICLFIKENKFQNIKTMIDTHNVLAEGFDLNDQYANYVDYIYHIHFSEINLQEIKNYEKYKDFIAEIKESYEGLVVYEFRNCFNFNKTIELFNEMF